MPKRIAAIIACAGLAAMPAPALAEVKLEGTDAEKAQLQALIDKIKMGLKGCGATPDKMSQAAMNCWTALENSTTEVVIKIGNSPMVSHISFPSLTITLDPKAIDCVEQVDKPGGGGDAKKSFKQELVLIHEALGHALTQIKGEDGRSEAKAMAKTNEIRTQLMLPTRTSYADVERNDEDKIVKATADFSDGSKIDATKALKKRNPASDFAGAITAGIEGQMQVIGEQLPGGEIVLMLDPALPPPQMSIDLEATGDGIQPMPMPFFQMVLIPNGVPEFPWDVIDLTYEFGPYVMAGQPIPDTLCFPDPLFYQHGIGLPDPLLPGDLPFEFQADSRFANPLLDLRETEGTIVSNLIPNLTIDPVTGLVVGEMFFEAIVFFDPYCPADLSSPTQPGVPDGALTGADFFEFLARFQAGDLSVDFSSATQPGVPDGALTGADFFQFLEYFSQGCP